MKRVLAGLAVVLALAAVTGCTKSQQDRFWLAVLGGHETEARAAADGYGAVKAAQTAGRPCADAYDYAIEAGFKPEQWSTLSYLCWRESMDTLTAVSSTHDYCWWQINRSAHQTRLIAEGIVDGSITELLYDPQKCANAAFDVWSRAGYGAWSTYRG